MRIISFIIAILLILAGGGCSVTWLANNPQLTDEISLLFLGFGVLPLIGGGLLLRYAWRDRDGGKGPE